MAKAQQKATTVGWSQSLRLFEVRCGEAAWLVTSLGHSFSHLNSVPEYGKMEARDVNIDRSGLQKIRRTCPMLSRTAILLEDSLIACALRNRHSPRSLTAETTIFGLQLHGQLQAFLLVLR